MGDHNPRKRTVSHPNLVSPNRETADERPANPGASSGNNGTGKPVPSDQPTAISQDDPVGKGTPQPANGAPDGPVGKGTDLVPFLGDDSNDAVREPEHAQDPEPEPSPEAQRAAAALERQARVRQERIEREEAAERKRRRRRIIRRIVFAILLLIILAAGSLVVAFGIFRWQTYDDAADIQGTWYHEATTVPITITDDEIVLTDEVAYRYVLDPEAKTILFRFGNMEGSGRYRFSLDRTQLVIEDGEFDWMGTFLDDAQWTAQSLLAEYVTHADVPLTSGSPQETVFTREPTQ